MAGPGLHRTRLCHRMRCTNVVTGSSFWVWLPTAGHWSIPWLPVSSQIGEPCSSDDACSACSLGCVPSFIQSLVVATDIRQSRARCLGRLRIQRLSVSTVDTWTVERMTKDITASAPSTMKIMVVGCSTGWKHLHSWLQMLPLRGSVVPAKFSASGIRETLFQSNIKCDARISKKLYAECRVVKRHEYVPRGF